MEKENINDSVIKPAQNIITGSSLESGLGSNVKSIHMSEDGFVIKEEFDPEESEEVAGVYIKGIQYYDLKNVSFINNTGIADLIELLRSLLKQGVEVKFVNVNKKIKNKIKSMGLDHILNCH